MPSVLLLGREKVYHRGWGRTPAGHQTQQEGLSAENLLPVSLVSHVEGVTPHLSRKRERQKVKAKAKATKNEGGGEREKAAVICEHTVIVD